jgi:two-component sensor histidine kinase
LIHNSTFHYSNDRRLRDYNVCRLKSSKNHSEVISVNISLLNLVGNSIIPGVILLVGFFYACYFALSRTVWTGFLAGVIFLMGTAHQIAEVNTWSQSNRVPSPDWILGDVVETAVYLLAVVTFFLFTYYFDRSKELLEQKDVFLDEMQHRVKNNLQSIQSLISLKENQVDNETQRKPLRTIREKIQSFTLMHEKLRQTDAVEEVNVRDYLNELCESLARIQLSGKDISLQTNFSSVMLDVDRIVACGLIVSELIENALSHGFTNRDSGEITVRFKRNEKNHLTVKDDGQGYTEPEHTSDLSGLSIVQSLVDFELDGDFEIKQEDGTKATVIFP